MFYKKKIQTAECPSERNLFKTYDIPNMINKHIKPKKDRGGDLGTLTMVVELPNCAVDGMYLYKPLSLLSFLSTLF